MLDTSLKQWLDREDSPSDFYQLIGQPRLCRNREMLLGCLEEASDYLFQVQNHKDKRVRDRARSFQMLIADARRTISDQARWEKYDQDLIAELHAVYRKNPNFSGASPKVEDLKRWLALVQLVEPGRVEELAASWTNERAPNTTAKPVKPELETQSHSASQTEDVSAIRQRVDVAEPPSVGTHSPSESAEVYNLSPAVAVGPELPTAEMVKRAAPPPPPARAPLAPQRTLDLKAPPPPPKETPAPLPFPTRSAPRSELRPTHSPVRTGSGNSAVLWIVMAAFLTALTLGLFGLVVAWASGALDGDRSHGVLGTEQVPVVLSEIPTVTAAVPFAGDREPHFESANISSSKSA